MFQDIFKVLHDDSKRHCNLKRDSESKLYLDSFLQCVILYYTYIITNNSKKILCCLTMSYITNKTLPNYVSHEILLMIIEETCHKTFVLTFTTIRFVIKQLLCRLEVSTTVVYSVQEQFS